MTVGKITMKLGKGASCKWLDGEGSVLSSFGIRIDMDAIVIKYDSEASGCLW
jgi:hypothetical protein